MKLGYVILLLPMLANAMNTEKDYSLYDYSALLNDKEWHQMYRERDRLEKLPKKDAHHFLLVARRDPHLVLDIILDELKRVQLNYVPDRKVKAYYVAERAMLMAKVLDLIPDTTQITKAQIKHAWHSNNKDVSRMMALCRKHPEDAARIIESHKQRIRVRFTKELAKFVC